MRYLVTILAALFLAGSGGGYAQTIPSLDAAGAKGEMARKMKEKSAAQFDAADVDRNGLLSRDEVAQHSPYLTNNFDRRDLDKDGMLNWEEFVGHDRWPK